MLPQSCLVKHWKLYREIWYSASYAPPPVLALCHFEVSIHVFLLIWNLLWKQVTCSFLMHSAVALAKYYARSISNSFFRLPRCSGQKYSILCYWMSLVQWFESAQFHFPLAFFQILVKSLAHYSYSSAAPWLLQFVRIDQKVVFHLNSVHFLRGFPEYFVRKKMHSQLSLLIVLQQEAAWMAHYLLNIPNLFAQRILMCYVWLKSAGSGPALNH